MTQEQAKRLCELEPERFRSFSDGLVTFDEDGTRFWVQWEGKECQQRKVNYGFMCWWMVTQMPDVVLCAPIMDGNWSCDDSRLERYGASRETPDEAVISAYIYWLESRVNK